MLLFLTEKKIKNKKKNNEDKSIRFGTFLVFESRVSNQDHRETGKNYGEGAKANSGGEHA